MPQMAPLNWLFLFIMFTIIFLMFNSINYFSILYNTKKLKINNIKNNMLNYKW
uniref:ATP synthase complex subunit 8 n=1 Tax=Hydrochus sp. BMNH1425167 TaxID=2558028 RepID=A0A191ZRG1_9COLE|nr:ATP synthase F0 subunit 8 [Hydrochus sp. BMNH1425167]